MRYVKMNGCGNDFAVIDARDRGALPLTEEQVRKIADRQIGVGCDQVIAIERSIRGDAFMRIWNADGGQASACGNAARCVAWLLMEEAEKDTVEIESPAGMLLAAKVGPNLVTVDMGSPLLRWEEIPLSQAMDTVQMDYAPFPGLSRPGAVNMGNPHVVFFLPDVSFAKPLEWGPAIETDPLFPQRVNVGFAQVRGVRIRLKVWERGAGLTKACGTGACAAVVAASRRGLLDRQATVQVDGGKLDIVWRESDDHVLMTGPIEIEHQSVISA